MKRRYTSKGYYGICPMYLNPKEGTMTERSIFFWPLYILSEAVIGTAVVMYSMADKRIDPHGRPAVVTARLDKDIWR